MLQIAVCDDNMDELSNMVQLMNQYRESKNLDCEFAIFQNGFELISSLEKGKRFDIYIAWILLCRVLRALMRQRKYVTLTKLHRSCSLHHLRSMLWKAIR